MFEYKGMLDDIHALESYDAISNLTTPRLRDYQTKDVLHALATRAFICMYDTGLGKSYVAGAYAKALKNAKIANKTLMIVTNSQVEEFSRELRKITGLRVAYVTESPSLALKQAMVESNDIILVTHGCLNVLEHLLSLNIFMDKFGAIVVDEFHLMSNFTDAVRAENLKMIINRFEYRLGLTATPITTDVKQLAKALHIIDEVNAKDWKKLASEIKGYGIDVIPNALKNLYVVRQRESNRHRGFSLYLDSMPHQIGAVGQDLFVKTKGPGATLQHSLVAGMVKQLGGKTLIYSNLRVVQKALNDYLKSQGIRSVIINGSHTVSQKFALCEAYRQGEYDCVITNLTTAVDLTSDNVIFYEFTSEVKQVIGRAERTLMSKDLNVFFIFTKGTDEIDYFYRNVYAISQEIEELLDIDLSEITKMKRSSMFNHLRT